MPTEAEAVLVEARALAGRVGAPGLQGSDEGVRLQQATDMLLPVLADLPDSAKPVAARILRRTAHYEAARSLGSPGELGGLSLLHDMPEEFLCEIAQVATDEDRLRALEHHRLWGERLSAAAARRPLPGRAPRAEDGRFRLGFLSSDLRFHVVGYFAQPIFEHIDPRFDLYCYSSFRGPPDPVQPWFEGRSKAFRKLPADDRDAAAIIAEDDLDLLLDLGGPTAGNRPGVLAYRPAPLQASWLGYPHSLGLPMDYVVADPYLAPARDELMLERVLAMPATWVCMSPSAFQDMPAVEPTAPVERNGFITFGTANDPYKFSPEVLRTWARVLAATPASRFMIIRPEAGARSFRENVARYFAAEGVSADRLDFRAVRGAVRQLYAEIDIALDTFPVTGGTTTCEALWMGVPTVTLVGPALYERLSWSLLNTAGLGGLGADTPDAFVDLAVRVAQTPPEGLSELRRNMRQRIRSTPLGQTAPFAANFYALMAHAIERPAQPQAR